VGLLGVWIGFFYEIPGSILCPIPDSTILQKGNILETIIIDTGRLFCHVRSRLDCRQDPSGIY